MFEVKFWTLKASFEAENWALKLSVKVLIWVLKVKLKIAMRKRSLMLIAAAKDSWACFSFKGILVSQVEKKSKVIQI